MHFIKRTQYPSKYKLIYSFPLHVSDSSLQYIKYIKFQSIYTVALKFIAKIMKLLQSANFRSYDWCFLNNLNKIITTKHTEKSPPLSSC